jgi:HD-GYP domain-containing protein (c-di-GMP phosphodiesterase class II)
VIASARLIEHSKNQISRLEALHDIDLVINSSMDLRVTLNILLDQVIEKLDVDAAVVLLLNPQTNMLEYTASHGFRTQSIQHYSIQMDGEISGKNAIERHLIKALNLIDENQTPYTELMEEEGFVSYYSVPLMAKGQVKGVLDIFNRTLLNPDDEWFNFLETLGGQAAIAIDNTRLLEELHQSNNALRLAYDKTLEGWSKALDLRDKETEGHTQRVVDMTLQIARVMGIPEQDQVHIRRGALLHDIGKMGIPDAILLKPGPLNDEEWKIMHMHPGYAYDLLYPIKHLRPALDIPYAHHEHWDGSGYPRNLKGENIPLAARIFAVIDVWDALTSDRPYRPAWSAKKAINYIQQQSGKYFDPHIVETFLALIKNELFSSKDQ